MFNVGGGEVLMIAFIALIVLGPQRLPGAARQIGKTMGELRRISSGFQNELRSVLDDPAPTTTPRRDALGAASTGATARSDGAANDPVASALKAVSAQPSALGRPATPERSAASNAADTSPPAPRRPRRAPLRAAPAAPADDDDGHDGPPVGRRRSTTR